MVFLRDREISCCLLDNVMKEDVRLSGEFVCLTCNLSVRNTGCSYHLHCTLTERFTKLTKFFSFMAVRFSYVC